MTVNGTVVHVPDPFPSPIDWRDCWMYLLMLDRFANDQSPPKAPWNQRLDYRQGGTFKGITGRLDYLRDLGVKALWLSPILKNPRPNWQYNYHGYDTQDFLNIDERFGSDGTPPTAEKELKEVIREAHARGIFVVLDMVINHAAHVSTMFIRVRSWIDLPIRASWNATSSKTVDSMVERLRLSSGGLARSDSSRHASVG